MDIRKRLDKLSGDIPPSSMAQPGKRTERPLPESGGMPSSSMAQSLPETKAERIAHLKQRLERMGVVPKFTPGPKKKTDLEMAELLQGECLSDGIICVEHKIPLTLIHGDIHLSEICQSPLTHLSSLGDTIKAERLLFLDTETTGLSGGTGTVAFLLGMGRILNETLELRQFFLTKFTGEKGLLERAIPWIQESGNLVTFNGKTFDIPLLAARYRLSRLKNPFNGLPHIDLLYPTRCAFAKKWPDCCLQTAEKRLLRFTRHNDLPGHLIPQAWFNFIRMGLFNKIPAILHHNRLDIISLVALMSSLSRIYDQPNPEEADILRISKAHLKKGDREKAFENLCIHQESLTDQGLLKLSALYRSKGAWKETLAIWEALADQGSIEAMERLAKYYEHVEKNYAQAKSYTELLISFEEENQRHLHRKERLLTKIKRDQG